MPPYRVAFHGFSKLCPTKHWEILPVCRLLFCEIYRIRLWLSSSFHASSHSSSDFNWKRHFLIWFPFLMENSLHSTRNPQNSSGFDQFLRIFCAQICVSVWKCPKLELVYWWSVWSSRCAHRTFWARPVAVWNQEYLSKFAARYNIIQQMFSQCPKKFWTFARLIMCLLKLKKAPLRLFSKIN